MRKLNVCLSALMGLSLPAYADRDVTLVSSIAFQNKQLSFDQQYSGLERNSAKFKANIPMVNLGFTAVYGKMFAALKMEKNLSVTSTDTTETDRALRVDGDGNPAAEFNLLTHPGGSVDVEREDASFTLGYNVWKRLNVFTGYIYGKTAINPQPFCANPFPLMDNALPANDPAVIACSRSNRSFAQFFLGARPLGVDEDPSYLVDGQPAYEQTYLEKGFFLGSSYAFNVEDLGTLAISFAYAKLDGKYSDNANDPNRGFVDELGNPTFVPFRFEGDTSGTSIALTWTGSLSERTAYTLDLRRQRYKLDADDQTGSLDGLKLDTEEEMIGLTVGIQVYL